MVDLNVGDMGTERGKKMVTTIGTMMTEKKKQTTISTVRVMKMITMTMTIMVSARHLMFNSTI